MEPPESSGREAVIPLLGEICSTEHPKDIISLEAQQGPLLQNKSGDWKAPLIILGFEYLNNVALAGVSTNLIVYLSTVLHGSNSSNATIVNTWSGTCFLTSLIGALIADTYWGCYKTICLSSLLFILGLVIISISSFIPFLKPPPCEGISCQPASYAQNFVFFSGLYSAAFGSGGLMSAMLPFGAVQYNEENPVERDKRGSFFVSRYFCIAIGALTSDTLIVWIEQDVNWSLGFSIATACFVLGFGGFILGTPLYRKSMPIGSPLNSIFPVVTASFRKMNLKLPTDSSLLCEVNNKNSNNLRQQQLASTDEFRFLDKAAVISNSDLKDGYPQVSWSLCTVTQVEELKVLLRLLPIWATSVLFTVPISQMSTTFVEQGSAMNTRIGSFSIPPASLSSFKVACAVAWILLYNKVISPATRRCHGNVTRLSLLQRMGLGHFLITLTMAVSASVEVKRLDSIGDGKPISIAWQIPQYFILGGADVFLYSSQSALFYEEAPESMKSVCTALQLLSISLGFYLSSIIVTLVGHLTTAGGSPGWIPDDLNNGHLDYFFWSLTALCTVNFFAFLIFASNYTSRKVMVDN